MERIMTDSSGSDNRPVIYGLAAVCLLTPLLSVNGLVGYAEFPKLAVLHVATLVFVVATFVTAFKKGRLRLLKTPLILPFAYLLPLITWSLLLVADNRFEAWQVWLHWTACGLIYFVVVVNVGIGKNKDILLGAVLVSGFAVACLGLSQFFFDFSAVPQTVAPAASFGNKNIAAHYVVMCLPLGFYFWLREDGLLWSWSISLAVATMSLFVYCAATKGAWLAAVFETACLAVVLCWWIFSGADRGWVKRYKLLSVAVCMVLAATVAAFSGQHNPFSVIRESVTTAVQGDDQGRSSQYSSAQVRLAIWRNSVEMIRDHPLLGVGLGNHKIYYPLYHQRVLVDRQFGHRAQLRNMHNDYIQFAAETGLAGVVFLVWFLAAGLLMVKNVFVFDRVSRAERYRLAAVAAALAGMSVSSLFSFPMQLPLPPFVLMIYLALLARQEGGGINVGGRRGLGVGVFISSLCLLFVVAYYIYDYRERRSYFEVVVAESVGDWRGMLKKMPAGSHRYVNRERFLYYEAEALMNLGRYDEAARSMEGYVRQYPYNINVLRNMFVIYSRLGRSARAAYFLERYIEIKPDDPALRFLPGG